MLLSAINCILMILFSIIGWKHFFKGLPKIEEEEAWRSDNFIYALILSAFAFANAMVVWQHLAK